MNVQNFIVDSHLKVHVYPNSSKTEIKGHNPEKGLLVNVKAPADKNKANVEIVKFFSKLLKKQVRIKKGMTSRDKVLFIE